jgi:hypothetical protein
MFVYALLNMDDLTKHRKDRLRALIDGKPYAGNQAEFGRKTGLTKARITQLLSPDEPFGERAAESLCSKLELPPRWFEQGHSTGAGEMLSAGGRAEASNATPAEPAGLGATLANLGELLSRTSPQTRAAVADLLGRYAQDPDSSQSLAQAIELLVKADQSKKAGA